MGRIRYIGVILYDADRIRSCGLPGGARSCIRAHLEMILDPHDPEVSAQALADGVPDSYLEAAKRSPVYKLIKLWSLAFPPHPEFRTLPMVWYVPPLSPMIEAADSWEAVDPGRMRIPLKYLANLLTCGDEAPVRLALKRLTALRAHMRSLRVHGRPDTSSLEEAGLNAETADEMYRLLAIAKVRGSLRDSHCKKRVHGRRPHHERHEGIWGRKKAGAGVKRVSRRVAETQGFVRASPFRNGGKDRGSKGPYRFMGVIETKEWIYFPS